MYVGRYISVVADSCVHTYTALCICYTCTYIMCMYEHNILQYTYVCIAKFMYVRISVYVLAHAYTAVCMHYIRTYVFACLYVHTHTLQCVYAHVCVYTSALV